MTFNLRFFRRNKPKAVNVCAVFDEKINTFEKRETMKKAISILLVIALAISANVAKADFTFGEATNLGPTVNSSSYSDFGSSLSPDGLSLYFSSARSGGIGGADIWVTTREKTDDPWGTPVNLGPTINTPVSQWGVSISSDGLSLYYDSIQSATTFAADLWVATRATTDDDWANPVNLGPTVNSSSADDWMSSISADGLELYFTSSPPRPGGYGSYDIYVTTRETTDDPWGTPVNLGPEINSSVHDVEPSISADGLMLFFARANTGIWVTRRATTDGDWGTPVNLGPEINSSALVVEECPNVSADGTTLFFSRSLSGMRSGRDLWQAPIIPIVDFNGDGIVDSADMRIMVNHWGEHYSLCDIGPMPWGDGIVDVQDFIVLAKHIELEVRNPALIAYWKLDEEAGNTAYDSIGSYDSILHGESLWQPDGGKVGGALQFDGIDDYVETDFIINPEDGSLSAFAWVKNGAPGQTIISQANSTSGLDSTWLCTDPSDGRLITKLMHPPFSPLESESVITDGLWHHVGVVYDFDGLHRSLYVDGIQVAIDVTPVAPMRSYGGLYIGTDKTLEAATFFSGLIDDVRIYDVALSAEEVTVLAQ
jgi:Tol biopolymer transport system component